MYTQYSKHTTSSRFLIWVSGLLGFEEKSIAFGDDLWYTYCLVCFALLGLLGQSAGKWMCRGFPDLVRSLWDLVLVSFCLPPWIKKNWAWKPPCSLQCRAWKQKRQKLKPLVPSPTKELIKSNLLLRKIELWRLQWWNLKNLYLRVALNFDFLGMVRLAFHGVFADSRLSFSQVWTWNHRRSMGVQSGCDFLGMMECGVPWGKAHPVQCGCNFVRFL